MFDAIVFSSFGEFIHMGGYAFNVWTVYGLFLVFLLANLVLPLVKRKQIIREQKRRLVVNQEFNQVKPASTANEPRIADSNTVGENQ